MKHKWDPGLNPRPERGHLVESLRSVGINHWFLHLLYGYIKYEHWESWEKGMETFCAILQLFVSQINSQVKDKTKGSREDTTFDTPMDYPLRKKIYIF